jgi:hypothetical protein
MENTGFIEISVSGSIGNFDLTPDNYDIREIISMLEIAEKLIHPGDKKDRPTIGYKIEAGSVKHIFKTSLQFVIGFNAVLGQIYEQNSIDFLDLESAKSIESLQEIAIKRGFAFTIKTALSNTNLLNIDKTTRYYRSEVIWADAEFYFYGKLTNAGGKDKANIHILTEEYGTLKIQTPKRFLEEYEQNLLYKSFGIRVTGKQHTKTGEIDTSNHSELGLQVNNTPKPEKLIPQI